MESVRAMKLASRMLVETPTVEKTFFPSVESMCTRTALPVPLSETTRTLKSVRRMFSKHRIKARKRLAQRQVKGVDRAVALVGGDLHALAHRDFHIRLRVERAGRRAGKRRGSPAP